MTPQEVFNKAYLGIIKQGKPAFDGNMCFYAKGALNCGVGKVMKGILPDNSRFWTYQCNVGALANSMIEEGESSMGDILKANLYLLEECQEAHDDAANLVKGDRFLPYYKERMEEVAKTFGLSIPSVE